MQDDPFLSAVRNLNKNKEEEEDPFLAAVRKTAGASAPVASSVPIKKEQSLQEASSGALQSIGDLFSGFREGVVKGSKELVNNIGALSPIGTILPQITKKPLQPIFKGDTKKRENLSATGEIGEFVGRMVPGVAVSIPVSGAINPVFGPAGKALLGGVAKKTASTVLPKAASTAMREALEVGITTIPQEIFAGSIAESLINPDSFKDWKSVARTASLSSIGSIFNMGGAYMGAIKRAKTIDELTNIQNQLKELIDDVADTGRIMPNVPEAQAGVVEAGSNRQLPTAQQAAMGRTFARELPDPNQLPTASEAAINRANSWGKVSLELQAQIDQRVAQLQNIIPQRQFDQLEIAASRREKDPIIKAAQKATDDRLWEWVQVQGGGGKRMQTDTRIPLEGVSTPAFLTLEELNDHLRVLNMASVMSEPKFKKGQRFIIPRTQLPTAEEAASRATGRVGEVPFKDRRKGFAGSEGPIPAIDKTVQASFKNIQARLDDAAARGIGTLDPQETAEIVNEMLAMSRRLSRGFEVPYTPKVTEVGPQPAPNKGTNRYVEGIDLPTSAKLDDPDWTDQIDPAAKRWITGSDDPPAVQEAFRSIDRRAGASAAESPVDLSDLPPTPPSSPVRELTEDYAESVRNANIDYSKKVKGLGRRTLDKIKDLKTEFYDRTWGVGKYSTESRDLLSLLSGVSAYADEFYENQMRVAVRDADGVFRGNTKVVEGIPLGQMLNGLKMDEIVEADAYLKAATTLDKIRTNPKFISDMSIQQATSIVQNAPTKIKEFGKNFKVIADALVDDMEATGRISAERAAEMKAGFYAGLSRSFNETVSQNALKMRKGSKRSSLPPIQLMRDHIFTTLERNRKNAAYAKLADLADSNPDQYASVIQKADLPSSLENVPGFTDMVEQFKKDGMLHNEAVQLAAMQIPLFDQSNQTMRVFRNGKMSLYKVNEDIQKTMEALNPIEFNLFRSILTGISAPVRTTTSLALDLSMIGPIADSVLTTARTPGFIPIVDSVRGFFHSAMKTPEYFERIAAGGGYGGRFEPAEVVVYKGANAKVVGKVTEKILHPLRWAQEIIRPLSDASRMGEYLVRRRGGETAVQAALASRRTLGDFNRVGASMRGWSLMTEFGNVGIQTAGAAYELGRNAVTELQKGNVAPMMRIASTGIGLITLPTIYFRMAAEGDDELNQYRKSDQGYRYWWTRLPFAIPGVGEEGDVVKYPKPGWWMGQVFGSTVEAALDGMDEEARRRLYDGIWGQVGINPVPLKAQQVFGLLANTRNPLSFGDQIPITPPSQLNLDPSVQGNERTSPLARTLADNFGINPFKTDFIVESAGGSFFGNIIRQAGPNPVKLEKTDVPVIGRFAVKKGTPTEGSSQFYRDLEEARRFDESSQKALDAGDVDKFRKLEEENALLISLRPILEKHTKEIGEVNTLIYTLTMDPNISPQGKREMIDDLRMYQNDLFRLYAEDRKSWIEFKK